MYWLFKTQTKIFVRTMYKVGTAGSVESHQIEKRRAIIINIQYGGDVTCPLFVAKVRLQFKKI